VNDIDRYLGQCTVTIPPGLRHLYKQLPTEQLPTDLLDADALRDRVQSAQDDLEKLRAEVSDLARSKVQLAERLEEQRTSTEYWRNEAIAALKRLDEIDRDSKLVEGNLVTQDTITMPRWRYEEWQRRVEVADQEPKALPMILAACALAALAVVYGVMFL